MADMNEIKIATVKLCYLMLGKTGEGKSATGNSILNRRAFIASSMSTSVTKEVKDGFADIGQYILHVVDTPGLMDTGMDDVTDTETAVKMMDQALLKCYDGVDAFLYVIKFGHRFTKEDRSALQNLKIIFGNDFLKHVIVVMTGGDLFQGSMEEEGAKDTFHQWCKKQKGEFRQFYDDCNGHFVLFANREKDESKSKAQVQEIVELSQKLVKPHSRYTSKCFQIAKFQRDKLIVEKKAPQLREEIQEKMNLLTSRIQQLQKNPSEDEKKKIRTDIDELRAEIKKVDQGFGVVVAMLNLVDLIEGNVNDVDKLRKLGQELEIIRVAKDVMTGVGAVCVAVGGAVALAVPPVGFAVVGLSCAGTIVSRVGLSLSQNIIEGKMLKTKKNINNDVTDDESEQMK